MRRSSRPNYNQNHQSIFVNRHVSHAIMQFKDSVVKPLLNKPSLDNELLSNYRSISNLSFLSKLSERVVLSRLNGYLTSNNLLNPNQSAYTKHHSTETLLTSLYNKLVMA